MDRVELGLRLQQWHSSMSDPIYAVGSFYFSGQVYPEREVAEAALLGLNESLDRFRKMLRDVKVRVWNSHYGRYVDDLKKFAGYTNKDISNHIKDLEEIVSGLEFYLEEDFHAQKVF